MSAKPDSEIADHKKRSRSGLSREGYRTDILPCPQRLANHGHDCKAEPDDALVNPDIHPVHPGRQRKIARG